MNVPQAKIAALSEASQALENVQPKPSRFKPYPEYRASGIDWLESIPEHWEVQKLKYLVALSTQKHATDGVKVGLENIESFTGRYIDTGAVFEGDGVSFQSGDILYGKLRPYLAKVLLSDSEGSGVGDFFVLHPGPDIVPEYLQYRLLEPTFTELADGSTFGAKMPRVDWKFMGNLKFSLPSEEEQRTIAGFLRHQTKKIDSLVAKKRRLIELLKEKRTALISSAVTKGLNPDAPMKPSGIDWLGDVPKHWEVRRLKTLFRNLNSRRVPVSSEIRASLAKVYPYYGASGIIDYVDEYLFDEPLILVAEDGANLLSRSTPLAFTASGKYWVNNHAHILRPIGPPIVFWEAVLQLAPLERLVTGSAQPKLTKENLGTLHLPVPPEPERLQIAQFITENEHSALIANVQLAIDRLQEYRSALISAAVTGKIDVREEVEA